MLTSQRYTKLRQKAIDVNGIITKMLMKKKCIKVRRQKAIELTKQAGDQLKQKSNS